MLGEYDEVDAQRRCDVTHHERQLARSNDPYPLARELVASLQHGTKLPAIRKATHANRHWT
jgi:hypothetical protein